MTVTVPVPVATGRTQYPLAGTLMAPKLPKAGLLIVTEPAFCTGPAGTLLLAAKERDFLSKIKPELDHLLAVRFFMDQELYERALTEARE